MFSWLANPGVGGLGAIGRKHPRIVADVRAKGLKLGVEFGSPQRAEEVQFAAFERGLLVLECGRQTVRLCSPLVVTAEEMETAIRIFGEVAG
jgi:4-aminobutyrate aminotransferase